MSPGLPEQWLIRAMVAAYHPLPSQSFYAFPRPALSPVPVPQRGLFFGASLFSNLYPKLAFKIIFAVLAICWGGRDPSKIMPLICTCP